MPQNETENLATLAGSALLAQYLESTSENLVQVSQGTKTLDNLLLSDLKVSLAELRESIGRTAGNLETSVPLVGWINKLIKQLTRPHEYIPFTLTCIGKVQQWIGWATLGHFNSKETIQDFALINVLTNVRALPNRNIIPDHILELARNTRKNKKEK